jgi:hypothetical protein
MPLRFVLDENLRGVLWPAFQQHNAAGVDVVDVTRVGDPPDLPLGTSDSDVLAWAEREGRIVVSWDCNTMPGHLQDHLDQGRHSPGVIILRPGFTIAVLVGILVVAAHASDPLEFRDQVRFLP